MSKKPTAGDLAHKTLWLILIAALLAVVINLVHPKRIPWIENWGSRVEAQAVAEQMPLVQLSDILKSLRGGSHLFVDARPAEEYVRAHLPDAVSLPFQTFEKYPAALAQVLTSDKPLVFYCTGLECDDSLLLALHLRKLGRKDVSVFIGGMKLWHAELLNTEGETVQ
ncbi:MAG: rhodanese-like domain-containing protein [Kiritimatiellales bacterium]